MEELAWTIGGDGVAMLEVAAAVVVVAATVVVPATVVVAEA